MSWQEFIEFDTMIFSIQIPWHTVFWGMSLQFIFALLILRTREGAGTVKWIGERLEEFFSYSDPGAKFLFGDSYEDHRFVFKVSTCSRILIAIPGMLYQCCAVYVPFLQLLDAFNVLF